MADKASAKVVRSERMGRRLFVRLIIDGIRRKQAGWED